MFVNDILILKQTELSNKYKKAFNTIKKNITYIFGNNIHGLLEARKYIEQVFNYLITYFF
jgi:hypothetical protein